MQSNGNGKFKNVSRLLGRMKTLQVKAQRKEVEDDRPSAPPHVHRAQTHKSSPNLLKKLSNDQYGLRKAYTAGEELADLDLAPFLGDDDRFRPDMPNELWQAIFEQLDVESLFSCHQVNQQFRKIIKNSRAFFNYVHHISLDELYSWPDKLPTTLDSPVWAPLAVLLYTRERNWETGKVCSLKRLTGLPSNNIGKMIFRYPYVVCTFLDDDSLRLWDLKTGKSRLVCKLHGLRFSVIDMVVENHTLAAAVENSSVVKVYNLETGYTRDTYINDNNYGTITTLRAEQDIIVAGYSSGALVVWDPVGTMEADPTPTPSKIVAVDIYEPYIIALSDNGLIRVFNTSEEAGSWKLEHVRSHVMPRLPPRAQVNFAQFTLSEMGPITLMAAASEPLTSETPQGTIFNFHQDSLYHLYLMTWPLRHEDAPTLSPRVRIWRTDLPGHNVRWDTFEFVNKSRAIVIDTDTNTRGHTIKTLEWEKIGKTKRTISQRLYCERDSRVQLLLDNIGLDGFVSTVGVSDDFMIVTGQWQCLFALNFAPQGLTRLIEQL